MKRMIKRLITVTMCMCILFSTSAFAQSVPVKNNAAPTEQEDSVRATPTYKVQIVGGFYADEDRSGNPVIGISHYSYGFGYPALLRIDGKDIYSALGSFPLYEGNTIIGNCYRNYVYSLTVGYHTVELVTGNGLSDRKTLYYSGK